MSIVWTQQTWTGGPANIHAVAWSPSLSLFVAVGNGSSGETSNILTSPDGITWTVRTHIGDSWAGVVWSPTRNLFVAVGGTYIITSPDGTNWTAQTSPNTAYKSVTWSPTLLLFVALSSSGANQVATSPDGINWTARSAANANFWDSVIWAPELSKFVAVATQAANTHNVMTSPDGTNWTQQTTASTFFGGTTLEKPFAWSGSLFAGVNTDDGGTTFKYMTSPDGVTWTQRARDGAGKTHWAGMVWALNTFYAFGSGAGFLGVASSADGITWTAFDPGGTARNWEGGNIFADSVSTVLAFNSDGARFVLAGSIALSVASINPSQGTRLGGTPVTITGTNFRVGATVTFAGLPATNIVVVNGSTITCVTPAHALGAVDVVVANPTGAPATLVLGYTYVSGQWLLERFDLKPRPEQTA